MSDFRPTPAQEAAIKTRGSAVLVSAGAGSGKTRVLTQRLMAYISDGDSPADLDSFLIITFTKAAAAELRGRIMEALSAAQAADPDNKRLLRQSALCRRARIGTIHSFCSAILRENSLAAGLTPDFAVADEERAQAMKAAALERVLDACYEDPQARPGFLLLADTVGAGRDDRRLAELTLELHEKMQCHPRPEKWAAEQTALLRRPAADAGETDWGKELLARALETAEYWKDELDRLMEAMAGEEKIRKAYLPSVSETAERIRELCRCLSLGWDRTGSCFPIPFPRLGSLRDSPDPALSERIKARRKACAKAMEELARTFGSPSEKLLSELGRTAPAMEALLHLALEFDREYAAAKRRAGLVDYADLEHMTLRLLQEEDGRPSALARELSHRYTEIMVDEYQDVSQVQDAIFRAVSREGKNLFMVGDVKQSIYRFRLADPEIFMDKYLRFQDAEQAADGEARRILLRENFRSRRQVLDAANAVFALCMSRSLGDIDYDEAAALICGAAYEGEAPLPELLLLGQDPGESSAAEEKGTQEAAFVAGRIRDLVADRVEINDKGRMRPIEYGDIAILLRSANVAGGVYRRALTKLGIPVSAGQSGGFFESAEVSTVISILEAVDNPHQDIPLIAALSSPAFGFTPDELAAIRAGDKETDFFTALRGQAETNEKCAWFLRELEELRRAAPDLSAAELTWRVLERFDLIAVCAAMEDGERRRARLMALAELSEQFEATGYRGLHRFVLWLRRAARKGREVAIGPQSASAVQIMSVHQSKGLEFPVVFLCEAGRRFNTQDSSKTVLIHRSLGLGPKVTDLERRVEYPSLARNAIKLRLRREMLSEELRLLYVAMTRARERLYITASLKDPDKALETAVGALTVPMAPELLAQASSYVQWLIYAALADGGQHIRMRLCCDEDEKTALPSPAAEAPADEGAAEELRRRLSFRYPYALAQTLPSKLTATELKGRAETDEEAQSLTPQSHRPFRMPDFTKQDKPVTGAERGTATHLVLQCMDFARTGDLASVRGEIERLRRERFLSDREARAVDAGAIVKLFASPLGQRMLRAEKISREFKFSLLCPAEELFPDARGEELLLQGVVDCFIEEAGQLTVIDYKTDYLQNAAQARERAGFYAGQLRAYARALRRICGLPVKECVLYFLSLGQAVTVATE